MSRGRLAATALIDSSSITGRAFSGAVIWFSVSGRALPSMPKVSFPLVFPAPEGTTEVPVWDGRVFRIGEHETAVLAYEVGQSGWTDELTTFHEETAGDDHYIDRASRRHAAGELRRCSVRIRQCLPTSAARRG